MKHFLKTKKESGNAYLFFEINRKNPKFKSQLCTMVSVDIQAWKKAHESENNLMKYLSTPEGCKVNGLLIQIDKAVKDLFDSHSIHSIEDREIIQEVISTIALADVRKKEAEELKRKQELEREEHERKLRELQDICKYYDSYIGKIRSGQVTNNGKPYSANTIDSWLCFGGHLKGFMSTRIESTFDEIIPSFRSDFVNYLSSKGLMKGAISLYVSKFRALCKAAAKEGYNNNQTSLIGWEANKAVSEEKKAEIYLTDEELDSLYKMPLKGLKCKVRDLFFVGAIISQRFSDYSRIQKDWVFVKDGFSYLDFTQQKTGKRVVCPLVDERLVSTLEKYDYNVPNMSVQIFDLYIHKIFEELASSVKSLNEEYTTAPSFYDQRTKKAKWELVSSHTARRSGITNMNKQGLLTKREMMAISGHTTEKIFEEYIKMGAMEHAESIAHKLSFIKGGKANAS